MYNTHELISETTDTVKIDGKLQVDDVILTGGVNLEISKPLKAPDLTLGSEKLSDHISMLPSSTHLLRNTEINGQLSIDGINCINSAGRLLLDGVMETPGLVVSGISGLGNTVIGGGPGDIYSHKESGPVMLTVGTEDSNDFKLCVRGKIVSDGVENSGYSSFTLFHHAELEAGSPTGLASRLYEWTGIPRLTHPTTGAPVSDWKTLHHAHSLSSVKLAESGNSQRIAGILHDIAAEKNDDEFNIHGHVETRHKYHGDRELLRIAAAGDHLCWCVQGGHEFSGTMLSGLWTHYENGVDLG